MEQVKWSMFMIAVVFGWFAGKMDQPVNPSLGAIVLLMLGSASIGYVVARRDAIKRSIQRMLALRLIRMARAVRPTQVKPERKQTKPVAPVTMLPVGAQQGAGATSQAARRQRTRPQTQLAPPASAAGQQKGAATGGGTFKPSELAAAQSSHPEYQKASGN